MFFGTLMYVFLNYLFDFSMAFGRQVLWTFFQTGFGSICGYFFLIFMLQGIVYLAWLIILDCYFFNYCLTYYSPTIYIIYTIGL